jgi:DNA-binding MarR family transcriptional regulator
MAGREPSHIDEVRRMLRELTVTTSMLHAQADQALSAVGQNLSRWQALSQYATTPTAVPAVARSMNHSRQYVQRITDDMTRERLVTPLANPGHRRSPLFSATPEGVAMLARLESSVSDWTAFLADVLSDPEIHALRTTLEHLRDAVNAYRAL